MLLSGAFKVLLLLITGGSTGIVVPPTNVTLSCSNLNVVVRWEYSEPRPQTSFRVHISGSAGDYVNETTEHRYDLSHFIWASEERYMGFHVVTVTAIEGDNQSEPVTSKTFTFNYLKPAHINCELDFPPVDVNEKDSGVTVSFMNPFLFYTELKEAVKPDTASFKFTISSDVGDFDGFCTAQQNNCKQDVELPGDAEKCVSLTGWLFDGNSVGQVRFRETGQICASKPGLHMVTLTIILFVLTIVVIVIIIIICKVKAWTMKIPSPPKPLTKTDSQPQDHRAAGYARVSPIDISLVIPSKKNPSVSSQEDEDDDHQDGGTDLVSQPPAGSYSDRGLPEGYGRDDDSADDSDKTETVSTDLEEEEVVSPYDCPHILQVDMGDGDMVTCYSERT